MKQDDFLLRLNELRLIVLKECEDGKFRQIELTREQFKKVGNDILIESYSDPNLKPGFRMAVFNLKPDWEMDADKFLGLSSTYDDLEEDSA